MNVEVEVVSDTSVRVSWDSVDIPEITGYTVYYSQTGNKKRQSEESITVPSSDNSVVIEGLLNNVEYQFQVVAIAELDGDVIMGQRTTRKVTVKLCSKFEGKLCSLTTDILHTRVDVCMCSISGRVQHKYYQCVFNGTTYILLEPYSIELIKGWGVRCTIPII